MEPRRRHAPRLLPPRSAGADAWSNAEPTLEGLERYKVSVFSGEALLRSWETDTNSALYSVSDIASDFPVGGLATITIAQIGADMRVGPETHITAAI